MFLIVKTASIWQDVVVIIYVMYRCWIDVIGICIHTYIGTRAFVYVGVYVWYTYNSS